MTTAADIDSRLSRLEAMPLPNDESARDALTELLATVGQINAVAPGPDEAFDGGLADRMKKWIKRLLERLGEIVERLGEATSFSISIGTGVSVTVYFGPFAAASS